MALIAPEGVTPEVMRAMAHSVGKHAYVGPGSLDDAIDLPTGSWTAPRSWSPPGTGSVRGRQGWWRPTTSKWLLPPGEDDSPDIMRLQWTPDRHVVLQRGWAPFARAERPDLRVAASVVRDRLVGRQP